MSRGTGPTWPSSGPVRQLRLVVAADEFDEAVDFYRDRLGLAEEESYTEDAARVMILGAGRATLELSNAAQRDLIDRVEVGRTGRRATDAGLLRGGRLRGHDQPAGGVRRAR